MVLQTQQKRKKKKSSRRVAKRTTVKDHSPNFSLLSTLFDIKSVAIVFIRNKKVGLCQSKWLKIEI